MNTENESELERGESGKKPQQLFRFEHTAKRGDCEIKEIGGVHYITLDKGDSVFGDTEEILYPKKIWRKPIKHF